MTILHKTYTWDEKIMEIKGFYTYTHMTQDERDQFKEYYTQGWDHYEPDALPNDRCGEAYMAGWRDHKRGGKFPVESSIG